MKNYEFTSCKITEVTVPGYKSSGNYSIHYEFWVDNKMYRGNQNYNYCEGLNMAKIKSLLEGKKFPVAYCANDPGTCFMLISK